MNFPVTSCKSSGEFTIASTNHASRDVFVINTTNLHGSTTNPWGWWHFSRGFDDRHLGRKHAEGCGDARDGVCPVTESPDPGFALSCQTVVPEGADVPRSLRVSSCRRNQSDWEEGRQSASE